MKPPPARPWLLAALTLCVALVPVCLAWRSYREEARRRDAQLFEATSGLVAERLQLAVLRHISFFNTLRNQLRLQPGASAQPPRLPPALADAFPHLIAFGYADAEQGRVLLRWTNAEAPVPVGTDLAADPLLAPAFERALHQLAPVAVPDSPGHDRAFIVATDGEAARPRGFVLGWISVSSLCSRENVPLLREGVLAASPSAGNGPAPKDGRVVVLREAGAEFPIAIARGPRFASTYGPLPPTLLFAAGAGCAVLLAFLVLETVRASQYRAELEAERLRGQLVQNFSHEFRTPLSVILSSADLLEAGGERLDAARRAEAIAQIQEATGHLNGMAEEVLLLSRLQSPRSEPQLVETDLQPFCEALARECAAAARCDRGQIEVRAGQSARLAVALLRPLLANLLSNALKYSAPEAPVRLTVERRHGALVFAVADSGIGIPEADLARVGEPFHRAANVGGTPGTGLGLAIVRRSAALLGGRFELKSSVGSGTTAIFTLPAP